MAVGKNTWGCFGLIVVLAMVMAVARACSNSNPSTATQTKPSAITSIALDKIKFLEGTVIEGSLEVDNERKFTAKCITTLSEGSNIIMTLSRVVPNLKPGYTYPTLGQDKKEVGKDGKITFGPFTDGGKGHLPGTYQIEVDCYKPGYSFGEFERLRGHWIVDIK